MPDSERNMRVAVTLEQCWHRVPGGTARATLDLVDAVAARGDLEQVGVSALHLAPPDPVWRTTIPVRKLPLPRQLLYETWPRVAWPPVERATGPVDLTHCTVHLPIASKAPWVTSAYDLHFLHEPGHFTARGTRLFNKWLDRVRDSAVLVLCPSEATRADCVEAGIEPDRLRVIPLGVDATAVPAGEPARVRALYGLDRPFVLFVGTVEPRKNLARLVEAYDRLGDLAADLVLVGPDGWAELPSTTARRLGFVPPADLRALYAAADVVAYPSLREGFGLPVLEAMAQGAPVVTSATTSTAEVAGDAALLVDPLDVDDIAGALHRLLVDQDLAVELGDRARARAATFTWARTADGTVAAYRDAVGAR
jgi:glycosyltransferase involved in cell wall biosynthesis